MSREILAQSYRERQAFFAKEDELLRCLVNEGQAPTALFIGCADSRVTPEQLFGLKPGDWFLYRNIANIVPPYEVQETGTMAVLEFAVLYLKIPHIIICGHTDCGGIKGLDLPLDNGREPGLVSWLTYARSAQAMVDVRRDVSEADRHRMIVEQNVMLQLQHLETYPFVQAALASQTLELHGWVYDLHHQKIVYFDTITGKFE